MHFTIGGYNFIGPEEITPGLEMRVSSAFSIAHLKDTGGAISYEEWRKAGLIDGWNATLEFLKAVLKPGRDAPPIEEALEKARPNEVALDKKGKITGMKDGEVQIVWNWYVEKKGKKKPSATASANALNLSLEKAENASG